MWLTLLKERVSGQLPGAHVGVLLVGVLPVVVALQRAGYVAGVMAVGTAERLQGEEEGVRERGAPLRSSPPRERKRHGSPANVLFRRLPICACLRPQNPAMGRPTPMGYTPGKVSPWVLSPAFVEPTK